MPSVLERARVDHSERYHDQEASNIRQTLVKRRTVLPPEIFSSCPAAEIDYLSFFIR